MKLIHSLVAVLLLSITAISWAGIPPKYLSVPGWQNCVDEVKSAGSTYSSVCLPSTRPSGCSYRSWSQLTSGRMLPSCGYKPSSNKHTIEFNIQ